MRYRIMTDEKKCVGCFACLAACIAAHHSPDETNAHTFRAIKAVRDEEAGFQKNVCVACLHCGRCMKVCLSGAIYRDAETGLVLADREKCSACGACVSVCPQNVIFYDEDGRIQKCDGCIERIREGKEPACVRNCYLKATKLITLT